MDWVDARGSERKLPTDEGFFGNAALQALMTVFVVLVVGSRVRKSISVP